MENTYKDNKDNCFIINQKYKIFSQKIKKEISKNDKNIIKKHFLFIKENISILLSINQFNISLKNKIEKNNPRQSEGYLINKNLLTKYKNIFLYDEIIANFNSNKNEEDFEINIKSFIISKKNYYFAMKQKKVFDIFKTYTSLNPDLKGLKARDNKLIIFTDEFVIIDDKIIDNLFNILKENIEFEKPKKIKYYFKEEKLIFQYINNNDNTTINICSKHEENGNIYFIPEIILAYSVIEDLDNQFLGLNKKEMIDNYYSKEICEINDKNGKKVGNSYLIKNNKNILNISYNGDNSNDILLKTNLNIWINIYIQQSKFNKIIKDSIVNKKSISMNCYIINKKIFDDLKITFHYEEINLIIKNFTNFFIYKNSNNNEKIEKIIDFLTNKVIKELNNIDENYLKNKFKNKEEYKIKKEKYSKEVNNNIYYYNNCEIINEEIFNLIYNLENSFLIYKHVECTISDDFITIKYDENTINVGYLNENNIFITEKIIYSTSGVSIKTTYDLIKEKGYKYFENSYNFYDNKDIILYNIKDVSYKLKILILLSIFQYKIFLKKIFSSNYVINNIYLLNKNWIEQYGYKEINDIINNDKNRNDFYNMEISEFYKDFKLIDEIINININKLKEVDKKILEVKFSSNYDANEKQLNLIGSKKITIYDDFIILNEELVNLIQKIFKINLKKYNISYLCLNKEDIIKIDTNNQHTIFVGNLDITQNTYNIKTIFDYNNLEYLNEEINRLIEYGYENYINHKIIFNDKKINDYILQFFHLMK